MTGIRARNPIALLATVALLVFGITLFVTKPAYAVDGDDPNSETVSDGIVTMTMQRSSSDDSRIRDYLFETTITIDARDLTFESGQDLYIDFSPLGMENVAHDETEPKASIDGGAFHNISDDNIVGFGGAIEGRGLHGSLDGEKIQGHVITIKVWNDNSSSLSKNSICNPLVVTVPASSTQEAATYSCDIDIQVSGGFYVIWDDVDDAAGKRPERNDYFGHISAYADGNPLTYTELTLNYPEDQPEGSSNVCAEYGTALTAHGESVEFTFKQEPVAYYTTTPTSGVVSAGATLTNTLATTTSTSGKLAVKLTDVSSGSSLAGGTYELRDAAGDPVATYSTDENGTFTLDPASTALASAMPAAGETARFTLVETSAPEGYDLDATAHEVTVSLAEDLDTSTLLRTRTFTFAVGGQATETLGLTNAKTARTGQPGGTKQPSDDGAKAVPASGNNRQKALPRTSDPLASMAVPLGLAALAGGALAMARRLRHAD
jgi:uncharacterized surface anchored protein